MRSLYIIILSFALLTLLSCNKDKKGELARPQPLLLKPVSHNDRLPDNVLDKVALYYYVTLTSEHKEYVGDFGRSSGVGYQQGILSTANVAALSADEDIKYFYLSFPDGVVDTLYVDYAALSDKDAWQDPCFCKWPQQRVLLNGHSATITGYTVDNVPIYEIPK